jgi:hypothetical protein
MVLQWHVDVAHVATASCTGDMGGIAHGGPLDLRRRVPDRGWDGMGKSTRPLSSFTALRAKVNHGFSSSFHFVFDRAVAAGEDAGRAVRSWRSMTPKPRTRLLHRHAARIRSALLAPHPFLL